MTDESIFDAALAIPGPAERAAFLDRACANNPALRKEVEGLLAAHAASNPLDRPPADLARTGAYESRPDDPPPAAVGDRIGPYRLMEQIGEGGFGLVFVAEQSEPVRRKVALKVLKPGMDTREVVARFEAERQALALMDHPNIARVLDAGSTTQGRPYFVMELVRGLPVTDYCDRAKLPPRDRLALFVKVCRAVQHAHQKGVIHRDLKPSNVLVTVIDGVPVPKVIDFGVAKAIGPSLTEKTIYTRFAQLIGTPLYMSPEQAEMSGVDVDTRSDVYALGVLLYELLTGTTPFDQGRFRRAAFDEIRRIIREEEPPRPSTRLTALGATLTAVSVSRGTDPAKLAGLVRGELDWIVMRCLEKDRGRRYDTATGLAKDVERYLAGDAVEACPPTPGYRLRKAYRKNRLAVRITAAFAVILMAGIIATTVTAVQARRAEALAREYAEAARDNAAVADHNYEQAYREASLANDRWNLLERKTEEMKRLATEQRRTLYETSMNLAQAAWESGNPARTYELLRQWVPTAGEDDLRGFEWHYWNRITHQEIKTTVIPELAGPGGDTASSHGTRLSPDGRHLAAILPGSGGSGAAVVVWDADSGRERWRARVETDLSVAPYVAFSRDGRRLATVHQPVRGAEPDRQNSQQLRVWDIATGRVVFTLDGAVLGCPSLSADGSRLALVTGAFTSAGARLTVLQLPDGRELFRYPTDGTKVILMHAAITPDGKRVAASGGGGPARTALATRAVRMWEIDGGREQWSVEFPDRGFVTIALSPDGRRLAVPFLGESATASVDVLDARSGETVATLGVPRWSGASSLLCPVAFDPSGDRLTVRQGAEVHLFDVAPTRDPFGATFSFLTRRSTHTPAPPSRTVRGHADLVWDAATDGSRLVTLDRGGTIKQWDLDSHPRGPRVPFGTTGRGSPAMPGPDGTRVVTLPQPRAGDWRVRFTDGAGRLIGATELPPGRFRERAFSADGRTFATVWALDPGTGRSPLVAWDARTGRELGRRECPVGYGWNTLAVSPDGSRIASQVLRLRSQTGKDAHTLIVWEPATGREVCSRGFDWFVVPEFTADGRRMLSVDAGPGRAEARFVWLDPETGGELRAVSVRKGLLNMGDSIVFSRDGRRMATLPAWTEDPVRVWDFEALDRGAPAEPLFALAGHGTLIRQVAFGPDNRLLTTSPGQVKLWDGASGRELLTLRAPGAETDGAYFSPDGHTIWGGLDEDGRLWGWDGTPLPEGKTP